MRRIFGLCLWAGALALVGADNSATNKVLEAFQAPVSSSEEIPFEAKVDKILKVIINSLYKEKDIFVRELLSNSSDALRKLRFRSLTDDAVMKGHDKMEIKVRADPELHTLTIRDTGLGMTRDELVTNLGNIGKSGTEDMLTTLMEKGQDTGDLIGKFGVGFYSAFLVAESVIVASKSPNSDKQYIWMSDAGGKFRVMEDVRGEEAQLGRGTEITLVLKEDARDDFENVDHVEEIVKKYSQFVDYPIYLEKTVEKPIEENKTEDTEKDAETTKEDGDVTVEDEKPNEDDDDDKKYEPKTEKVQEFVHINTEKPLWLRDPKEVSEEQYKEFYNAVYKDNKEPFTHIHFRAEGDFAFQAMLYVPATAPSLVDLRKLSSNVMVYSRRVLIMDEISNFLPWPLIFLQGVISSDELQLNVSRETIQGTRELRIAKKTIINKALAALLELAESNPENYTKFFREYSQFIKGGVADQRSDFSESQQNKLKELLRFPTSRTVAKAPRGTSGIGAMISGAGDPRSIAPEEVELVSLSDYVSNMKEGQKYIYYLTGTSLEDIDDSPFVEGVKGKGYEVFYLADPPDESVMGALKDYKDRQFKDLSKTDIEDDDDDEVTKAAREAEEKRFEPLKKWLEKILRDFSDKTVISKRLKNSACTVVSSEGGWSPNMERLVQMQAHASGEEAQFQRMMTQMRMKDKKTFEINPAHPIIVSLLDRVETSNHEREILKDVKKKLFPEEEKKDSEKETKEGEEKKGDEEESSSSSDTEFEPQSQDDKISSQTYERAKSNASTMHTFTTPNTVDEFELAKRAFFDREKALIQVVRLMFENAMYRSGYEVRDRIKFSDRVDGVIKGALGIGDNEAVKEAEKTEAESVKEENVAEETPEPQEPVRDEL